MKRLRWYVSLGSVAVGIGAAVVAACGGNDLTMCGAGTVNVGGVCVVAADDGSVADGADSPDVESPDEGLPLDDSGSDVNSPLDGGVVDADSGPPNRCPYGKGPVMAEVPNDFWDAGTFCIDTTEVSEAQYDAFLTAIGGGKGDAGAFPIPACANNADFTPGKPSLQEGSYVYDPSKNGAYPVRGVSWCDAFAYCRWAGKRLCQRYDKSAAPDVYNDAGDWRTYETNIVCSQNDKNHKYAYGNTYQSGMCPPDVYDGGYLPVGTSKCRGTTPPYSDVYDTSGSVLEWYGACYPTGCTIGGAATCAIVSHGDGFSWRSGFLGFRCCAD